jgi:hypothetical protein
MATVSIKNVYLEMLSPIGRVDSIVEEAVRKYLIDKCVERLEKAKSKIREFEKRYSCHYSDFCLTISDENQLEKVEKEHPTWEADNAEWEYWQKELEEWKTKLEDILMKS